MATPTIGFRYKKKKQLLTKLKKKHGGKTDTANLTAMCNEELDKK